nr:response regulator transcription factor [Azospirillum soli]
MTANDTQSPETVPASRILLVDDHALLRRGLALTILTRFPDALIFEAGSLTEALQIVREAGTLSAVIYDLGLPDAEGLPGLRLMLEAIGTVPVLVITGSSDPTIVGDCIGAGASGFLPKWCNADVLEHALPLVLNGGTYAPRPIPPSAAPIPPPLPISPSPMERPPSPGGTATRSAAEWLGALTDRQQEVLRLLIAGQSNKEIARELGVLEGTVKVHVRAIMQQLKARNRTQVTMAAARAGLFV